MSYHIVRITNLYKVYLSKFYSQNPDIIHLSYVDQLAILVRDSYESATSFTKNLRLKGVQANDILTNANNLQSQWKIENNSISVGRALVIDQVFSMKPDIVWIDDPSLLNKDWIKELKVKCKTLKFVGGHICTPYGRNILDGIKQLDFVFTCIPCMKRDLEKDGIKVFLLYHSFDTDILHSLNNDNHFKDIDLLFTGSLQVGGGFHNTRIEYLEYFLKKNIPVTLFGNIESNSNILKKKGLYITLNILKKLHCEKLSDNIPLLSKYKEYGNYPIRNYSQNLRKSVSPSVFGMEMFKQLSKSKICFNIHGEIASKCAGNVRLFEVTGVGSCLITDKKENIRDLFEPEKEIITYTTKEECAEKIIWYLEHPEEVNLIAKAGQNRTLKDHTQEIRAEYCNKIFLNLLQEKKN